MFCGETTQETELLIWCDGGLGNRLRPLLSAMNIVNNSNNKKNIVIVWRYTRMCEIMIDKLFNLKSLDELTVNYDHYTMLANPNTSNQFTSNGITQITQPTLHIDKLDTIINKNILINTPHWLNSTYLDKKHYPKIFRNILYDETVILCLSIKKKLCIDKNVIGCHLRSTDLQNASKLNKIIDKIKENQQQRYFVCSDNENTEKLFYHLKNVVIIKKQSYVTMKIANKGFHKNCLRDELSVQEALIDLCIMSMCDITNNSYHTIPESSFLDVARNISGWENP